MPYRAAVAVFLALSLAACAGPAKRFDRRASELGFVREEIRGEGFRHAVFRRLGDPAPGRLHVYLGSDGTPWHRGRWPADDPTPRSPLGLELMALDPGPAVYLGRPCYHGLAAEPGCTAILWTDRRYSREVVASMAAAIRRLAGTRRPVVLIGYSGGGALAMLIAPNLDTVAAVVTVAADLDVDAWAKHHGYRPLAGSLNPADQPSLDSAIVQIHLAGADDERVPPALVAPTLARLGAPPLEVLPAHNHRHGWRQSWPAILSSLDQRLGSVRGAARQPE